MNATVALKMQIRNFPIKERMSLPRATTAEYIIRLLFVEAYLVGKEEH